MVDTPSAGEGQSRLGRFRLDRILGSGGFATVWLAHDDTLDAAVAIKVLAENWAHDEQFRHRFTEEARVLWRLESAHIVRVYGVDETAAGQLFFVMEYADAGNLEDRMKARLASGRQYSIDEALSLSVDIADGLVDAQKRDIVHRDLKPSNVLFKTADDGPERLLLADFGIARSLENAGAVTIAAGTPHYMAPEQTEGRADRASDVYSAAVILYELLAGRVPFPYQSAGQVIRAQITEQVPPVETLRPDTPAWLGARWLEDWRLSPPIGMRQPRNGAPICCGAPPFPPPRPLPGRPSVLKIWRRWPPGRPPVTSSSGEWGRPRRRPHPAPFRDLFRDRGTCPRPGTRLRRGQPVRGPGEAPAVLHLRRRRRAMRLGVAG